MRNRHYLEIALETAIRTRHTETASKLINLIQAVNDPDPTPPSLRGSDASGANFLHLALYHNEPAIAEQLFALLKDDKNILFQRNEDNATLIHIASIMGNLEILKKLIAISANELPDSPGYKLWLAKTKEGFTPLHNAAEADNLGIATLLLEKINQEQNALELINQTLNTGITALSCTSNKCSTQIAELLMRHGADVCITNNKGETLFDRFDDVADKTNMITYLARHGAFIGRNVPASILPELQQLITTTDVILVGTSIADEPLTTEQIAAQYIDPQKAAVVFKTLTADEQSHVLKHCAQQLKRNPDVANVKTFYYSCLGAHNKLMTLVAAHLEHDRNIELRDTCIQTTRRQRNLNGKSMDIPDRNGNPEVSKQEMRIPDQILALAPTYAAEISAAKQELILPAAPEEEISVVPAQQPDTKLYAILNADRARLCELITHLQTYQADLQQRPRDSFENKVKVIILLSSIVVLYFVIEGWLVNEGSKGNGTNYYTSASIFGLVTPALVALLMALVTPLNPVLHWKKEISIAPEEYEHLTARLDNLLALLHEVENREAAERELDPQALVSYLPTAPQNIRDLENQRNTLNKNNPISKVIHTLEKGIETLQTIQTDMNFTNNPISLFARNKKPDVVVAIDSKSADEEEPLLGRQAVKRGIFHV